MLSQPIPKNCWTQATWEGFLALTHDPAYKKAKFYFNQGWMRIDMSPVGPIHAREDGLLGGLLHILLALRYQIPYQQLQNPTLRQPSLQEAQPDLAYYFGTEGATLPVFEHNAPIDIRFFPAPDLAIEVAATTLTEDLNSASLYAQLGVREYWVLDTKQALITAFAGTEKLEISRAIPGLRLALLEEALSLGRVVDHGAALRWIMAQT